MLEHFTSLDMEQGQHRSYVMPYYPLAGRLHVSDHNQLQIACTGEGVWFVEALVDCTLDALNYFDDSI